MLLFFISFSNQQFRSIFDLFSCAATVVACNRQPLLKSTSIITAVSHIQQIRDAGDAHRDAKLHLLIKIFSINFSPGTVRETHLTDKIVGTQLSFPHGLIVEQLGHVYVADSLNDRTMRWSKESKEGSIVVGGNRQGEQPNQLYYPIGLSFDRQSHLYVVDCNKCRVQKFEIDLK